jgi:hypothetical protein
MPQTSEGGEAASLLTLVEASSEEVACSLTHSELCRRGLGADKAGGFSLINHIGAIGAEASAVERYA